MRAIWSGAIGFGLVNIPVKLFSATQSSDLGMDMLDKKDHSNIRFLRVNEQTGKKVEWEDIVKGYKYNDEYVVLTDEDFEKAGAEKSKMIGINEFVEQDKIDTIYYDTPYYLEPAKGGENAYRLLREALSESGKVAVGTFVMRTKEALCLLKPAGKVIELIKMRFPEEVRDIEEVNVAEKGEVKPAEMKMALALIDQLTTKKFEIDKYKNTYTEKLMDLIESKAKGIRISKPKMEIHQSKTKDLMAQLKASLDTGKALKKAS